MSNHHNKGMRDSARNNHRPPHDRGIIGELLFGYNKKEIADRKSYSKGWKEGRKHRR